LVLVMSQLHPDKMHQNPIKAKARSTIA